MSTSIQKITLEELNVLKKELLSEKLWPELIDLIASNFMNLDQLRNDLKAKLYLCKNIKTLQLYNYTIKMFLQFKNSTKALRQNRNITITVFIIKILLSNNYSKL